MMIELSQVSKHYPGGFDALKEVDFSLEKGEMVFLTGHSGAGKSTFLRMIACLEAPSSGQILVNQTRVNQLSRREAAEYRARLGITFQMPHLLMDQTVFDNVALPLRIQGFSQIVTMKRVQAALDKVGLLHKQKLFPKHLSGGEQQRVGIARAVVHKPALLIADEPTGNLDPYLASQVMNLFEQFHANGTTVLIATHDLALIAGMKHRMVLLKEGKIC